MKLLEAFDRMKLLPPVRRTIKKLFEGGAMDPDAAYEPMTEEGDVESSDPAMAEDPAETDPETALRAGFRSACVAVLDDSTLPASDKVKRLKELLTTAERLLSSGVEIPEQEEEEVEDAGAEVMEEEECEDEVMEEFVTDKPVTNEAVKSAKKVPESKQSLRRQVARLKAEKECVELCRVNGVEATSVLLEALSRLPSESKRLALIEPLKSPRKARTTSANVSESKYNSGGTDISTEDFVKVITAG